ncbi:MAG TPA: hypothetical protein VFS19_02285 [Planctomycetota bacterium]|nr:hypothetical protein [Planctomycetota bacterium]
MKWLAAAVLAWAVQGCMPDFENPHLGVRGLSEEELNKPPGDTEIKSAIINDIRSRRGLHLMLDEGQRSVPEEIKLDKYGQQAVLAKDGAGLWKVQVRADDPERLHAVFESAYWDDANQRYFYHYEGGNPHRDVWMGPYPIKFSKRPAEDPHGH